MVVNATAFGASSKGSSSTAPSSGSGDATDSNPEGFAIESEMLTYTAMDSEATALTCGIGHSLGAADASCTAQAINGPPVGVVVVSGDSDALSEFQLWRTDISTMDMLTLRADHYCAPSASTRAATTLGGTILSMFPESQAAEFAASLLSATAETKPLEGNILDRTLVNDVAGHLRALGMDVVIPDSYMPYSLTAIDANHSPFLTKYVALMKARSCVVPSPKGDESAAPAAEPGAAGSGGTDAHADADKQAIKDAIDAYLKSLTEPDVFDSPKPQTPPGSNGAAAPAPVISHLNAVLRADGLAQELDAASPDARSGANGVWYVLSLTALESGGTLLKSGNAIKGTKTSYSGGAVGTYALFRLNGDVTCSGVFFNYEPPTLTAKIPALLTTPGAAGGKVVGGCH
jgi:hypothetical protein